MTRSPTGAKYHFATRYIMTAIGLDSLQTRTTLNVGSQSVDFYSLRKVAEKLGDVSRLPFSMKVDRRAHV